MTNETDIIDGISPRAVQIDYDPRLPPEHTLPGADLRKMNLAIECLWAAVQNRPVDRALRQSIETAIEAWRPLQTELQSQHAEYQGRNR